MWLLLAVACGPQKAVDSTDDTDGPAVVDSDSAEESGEDADGDGYDVGQDCDDDNAEIHPGADERCDGIDEDCDGSTDEDAVDSDSWYRDRDDDGFGSGNAKEACTSPGEGWTSNDTDCDDSDAAINPLATEISCSGADDDCDGIYGVGAAVGTDGTVYDALGAALAAAGDGETVTVCEGTLRESVTVDHPVIIEGMTGAVLKGTGSGAVLAILADATVRGLSLAEGTGWSEGGSAFGGLVFVEAGVSATLEDIEGEDGEADFGGCVMVGIAGQLDLSDSSFEGCTATELGGVLYAQTGATITLDGVDLSDGEGGPAGGVLYLGEGALAVLADTTVQGGQATLGGGAYLAAGAAVSADEDTWVQDSEADYGGGLYLSEAAAWSGGTLRRNEARDMGGGVYVSEADAAMDNATVKANNANWGGGFAVLGDIQLTEVSVDDNVGATGGGFYILDGSVAMEGGSCAGNSTPTFGGGASVWAASGFGSIDVTRSDWGTGSRDNTSEDVYTFSVGEGAHTKDSYGSNATFRCTAASGC